MAHLPGGAVAADPPPVLVWIAPDVQNSDGFDMGCLGTQTAAPVCHDNLFHSVLGLMDVTTGAYDRSLDVFAACRRKRGTAETEAAGT